MLEIFSLRKALKMILPFPQTRVIAGLYGKDFVTRVVRIFGKP